MKQLLLLSIVILMFGSCALQKQTSNTSKTLGIYGAGVIQKPVLTNLKVNPVKVTSHYVAGGIQDINYHKSQAIAKAMLENKVDVIIEPGYEITQSGSSITIVVTGYAGNYENFRPLTGADTSLLVDAGIINYNNGSGETPVSQPAKKKGKGGLLLVLLLLGGAVAAGSGVL